MEYEGYLTKEEVLEKIVFAFPFMGRPSDDDLYVYDESDGLRRIISSGISEFRGPELPCEGVMVLYDEFSTISQKAVNWLLPSMLRIIIKEQDPSGNLYWFLPAYFEHLDLSNPNSAYNFSWLSRQQLSALNCLFEYLSEKYDEPTAYAIEKLREIEHAI